MSIKSQYLKSIRESKLYEKRQKYVHLTTQDNEYFHRFIENYSNSTLETTESEIQNDSNTECQKEGTT